MNCDTCKRPTNYSFYVNEEHWQKVVGAEWFAGSLGRICAHCTLEKLGGASWYIFWNEPVANIRRQEEETARMLEANSFEVNNGSMRLMVAGTPHVDIKTPHGNGAPSVILHINHATGGIMDLRLDLPLETAYAFRDRLTQQIDELAGPCSCALSSEPAACSRCSPAPIEVVYA